MIMSKLEHIALETVHVFILDANKIQYLGDCVIKGGNRFNKKLTIELPDENRSIDIFDGSYLTRQSFLEKADSYLGHNELYLADVEFKPSKMPFSQHKLKGRAYIVSPNSSFLHPYKMTKQVVVEE